LAHKTIVFVSSSSDLKDTRQTLAVDLKAWLHQNGVDDVMAPYLWEDDTDDGRMLSARQPIQEQLPDPYSDDVPFTLCLFAERCGVPLQDSIPDEWERRIASWRAAPDGPGLIHPWPQTPDEQNRILDAGGFPLTGTVFELISAHAADADMDNLVLGYVANRYVEDKTGPDDLFFNNRSLWDRLVAETSNERQRKEIREEIYEPQIRALLNLLKYLAHRFGAPRCYPDETAMAEDVFSIAKEKLRGHFGFTSTRNSFKATLEHWSINDRRQLPGRNGLIKAMTESIEKSRRSGDRSFVLIKGRSGCGKSSILQRGVLARLRERGDLALPFRPTDLEDPSGARDRIDVLWLLICDCVEGCADTGIDLGARRGREKRMAARLTDILERRRMHLVLGIDQFEEILDELRLLRDQGGQPKGWWLVLRFLRELAASSRVQLVGTLESQRWETFQTLGIEKHLGVRREVHDADVGANDIARIAEQGFARAGLPLDKSLIEEIKTKWEQFEDEHARDGRSASPLPLACLWFAKLYDRFEYRAGAGAHSDLDAAVSTAFKPDEPALTLDDLGADGVAFEGMIAKLADEAWMAAGCSPFADEPVLESDQYSRLNNFLQPLIGLDVGGHKRLLTVSALGADATTTSLRASFQKFRLLVPAGDSTAGETGERRIRLRLVHQSVIDQWRPARDWFDRRQDYLNVENLVRLEAKHWMATKKPELSADRDRIQNAAQVLNEYRGDWLGKPVEALEKEDAETRSYALSLFALSIEPSVIVNGSIFSTTYAHLASIYHLTDLLAKFTNSDPDCLKLENTRGGTLLHAAGWSDGDAVPYLVRHKVPLHPPQCPWSAIEGAIQVGADKNYLSMVEQMHDLDAPIGPVGITMLHSAARYGNCFVLNDLLAKNVNLSLTDEKNRSALHWAAFRGQEETFRKLLPFSDVTAQDDWKDNPVSRAASFGHANLVRAVLNSDEIDDTVLKTALSQRNNQGHTPLMAAAYKKQSEVMLTLLEVCDPGADEHKTKDRRTLLHLAAQRSGRGAPTDDEKLRARRTMEVLLKDGRLDPNVRDDKQRTAYDMSGSFEDARRVLRRDPRMPTDYAGMSEPMRVADLTSRNPAIVLSLLRAAPQALTERHEGESGIDILVRTQNVQALATALDEGLVDDALLEEKLDAIAALAGGRSGGRLCGALAARIKSWDRSKAIYPVLLGAALRDGADDMIETLIGLGASTVRGTGDLKLTVFHDLAVRGETDEFEKLAGRCRLALPLDAWGRRPSDLAALRTAPGLRDIEDRLFDPSVTISPLDDAPRATRFHAFARKGDVKGFERQARGVDILVPLDEAGLKPSEVAPKKSRKAIAKLEDTYFMKEH